MFWFRNWCFSLLTFVWSTVEVARLWEDISNNLERNVSIYQRVCFWREQIFQKLLLKIDQYLLWNPVYVIIFLNVLHSQVSKKTKKTEYILFVKMNWDHSINHPVNSIIAYVITRYFTVLLLWNHYLTKNMKHFPFNYNIDFEIDIGYTPADSFLYSRK